MGSCTSVGEKDGTSEVGRVDRWMEGDWRTERRKVV